MAVNQTQRNTELFHTEGRAETLIQAICPLTHISPSRKRRSDDSQSQADFAYGFKVYISNDGINFGNDFLDVYVFDSTCQIYTNGSIGMTFHLKDGYCHIEGKCVQNGTLSMQQTLICDTRSNKFNWTMRPTTTKPDTTTSSLGNSTKNPDLVVNRIVNSEAGLKSYKLKLTIDTILDSSHDLDSPSSYMKVSQDTKDALKHYYQGKLGIGLKDVVITSLKKGSLIVEYVLILKSDEFVTKALSIALADLSSGTKIELFEKSWSVSNVQIENSKVGTESDHFLNFLLCESYTQLHPCTKDEVCDVMNGIATCKQIPQHKTEDKTGKTNMVIIISSSVGGVLVIVIFALVVVLCCKRKKSNKRRENRTQVMQQNEYNEMNLVPLSGSNKKVHDNPAYSPNDSAFDSNSYSSRSVYDDGSVVESRGGYTYYYGKKDQEEHF